MKRLNIMIIVFLMLMTGVFGTCYVNEDCVTTVVNPPDTTDEIKITYRLNDLVLANLTMTNISDSMYSHTEIFTETGDLLVCADVYYNDTLLSTKCITKDVIDGGEKYTMDFIILIIIIGLLLLAFITKQSIIGILASIGVVIYGISIFTSNVSIGIITTCSGLILMLYFLLAQQN